MFTEFPNESEEAYLNKFSEVFSNNKDSFKFIVAEYNGKIVAGGSIKIVKWQDKNQNKQPQVVGNID